MSIQDILVWGFVGEQRACYVNPESMKRGSTKQGKKERTLLPENPAQRRLTRAWSGPNPKFRGWGTVKLAGVYKVEKKGMNTEDKARKIFARQAKSSSKP